MGMAPYGNPTRVDDVYKLVEMGDDSSFRLNMDYFAFHHSTTRTFSNKFVDLFGVPPARSDFYTATTHPKKDHPKWGYKDCRSQPTLRRYRCQHPNGNGRNAAQDAR